jgi:hypothetical protein
MFMSSRLVSTAALTAALTLMIVITGCLGPRAARPFGDGPHIALGRGGHWSVLKVRPPHISGPHFQLVLRHGNLTGTISSETAPGGALSVRITDDGASGFGAHGPVSLDFASDGQATIAQGFWNGQRVHLELRAGSLSATVADNSARGDGVHRRLTRTPPHAGRLEPAARDTECSYQLDRAPRPGALQGASTCEGLPQATDLEISPRVTALLKRSELLTVLVAVLSAPPLPSEGPSEWRADPWPAEDAGDRL